jgi:signal transduction histidine kinase
VEPLRAENGEIMGLTVAALDISERKRAEERMAQLQAVAAALSAALTPSQVYEVIVREAASALDDKAGALYIVSDDGQWLDLVQITGYGEGASEADLRFPLTAPLPAAEAARTGEAIWLESTQTGDAARSQWPDKDETTGYEAAASLPLWFEGQALGSLNFSFATARALDPENREFLLTLARVCAQALERARLYQKAQQLNTELEQRVAERTAELERSLQDLNHFTYVASHDLKAPLRAVDYLANWIVADAGDVLPEASKIHLAKLQGRIKRMERLLDDLLTYSRVDRHYYQSMESVDTGVLIKEIIDLLTPPLGFTIAVQEKMPRLMAHRVLLELIFKNLIENAIKHHHRADGRVDISAREVDGFVEFCVADDGPGIDDIFHERIFQIFQTLQPRDKVEGTGVGLAIVKRAVESQGGAISVISARGQGTTFRFTWPKGQTVLETA